MSVFNNLDTTLNNLQELPSQLQKNFSLMREMNRKSKNIMTEIDVLSTDMMENMTLFDKGELLERRSQITNLYGDVLEYGDDKVQLAIQTYELVDKHIRKLDSDLLKYEEEEMHKREVMEKKAARLAKGVHTGVSKKSQKKAKDGKGQKKGKLRGNTSPVSGKKKGAATAAESAESNIKGKALYATFRNSLMSARDGIDMPVDPNEPTYCYCDNVSYGEMIGCDNPECSIEWFHFGCVNLVLKPKGKWFCPTCVDTCPAAQKKKH